MWETKVVAAADADAAETNWKHKVTQDLQNMCMLLGIGDEQAGFRHD